MSKLSIFPASLSTAHSFTTVLSKENLKKYARDCGALKRERKFSISDYILTSLSQMSKSTETSGFTLHSVHDAYLSGWQKLGRITFFISVYLLSIFLFSHLFFLKYLEATPFAIKYSISYCYYFLIRNSFVIRID